MGRSKSGALRQRVESAAEAALARQKYVAPVEVLSRIGWLPETFVTAWRQGRTDHLLASLNVAPERIDAALGHLRAWAEARGLQASDTPYVSATRDRRDLRFTASGDPATEATFRTHWLSPDLGDAARTRLRAAPDLVVVEPVSAWSCAECGSTGEYLVNEGRDALCLTCADLDHLIFLPAGDAALTRRSKKLSTLSAVVVRWNRSRRRYERRGLLVEEAAIEAAEEQCLADADVRERRRERDRVRRAEQDVELQANMAELIVGMFPGCPAERAREIAGHAALRGSGRVGRSAAGRALEPEAVRRAVVASVRHLDTEYDTLLMSGVPRDEARERIREEIDRVLAAWSR